MREKKGSENNNWKQPHIQEPGIWYKTLDLQQSGLF